MNTKFKIESPDHCDYKMTDKKNAIGEREITLRATKRPPWSDKMQGKKSARMTDDGNGLEISFFGIDGLTQTITLDYSQACELQLLLRQDQPSILDDYKVKPKD